MGVWDWLIVLVPLTFIMGMAWYSQRFIRGVADFLAAGRVCGRYVIAVAGVSVSLSVMNLVANAEVYYKTGFAISFWNNILLPVSMVLALTGFCYYRFRETRSMSIGQFLEMRYNRPLRIFASGLRTFSEIITNMICPAITARFFIYLLGWPEHLNVWGMQVSVFALVIIVMLIISIAIIWMGGTLALLISDTLQSLMSYPIFTIFVIFVLCKFSYTEEIIPVMSDRIAGESFIDPFDISSLRDFNLFALVVTVMTTILNHASWIGASTSSAGRTPHEQKMAGVLGTWRNGFSLLFYILIAILLLVVLNHRNYAGTAKNIRETVSLRLADEKVQSPEILSRLKENITNIPVQQHTVGKDAPLSQEKNLDTVYLNTIHDSLGHSSDGNELFQEFRTLYNQMLLPATVREVLPAGLIGSFALLMIMLMISTDSTRIFSSSITLVQDVVLPLCKEKQLSSVRHILMLRAMSIFVGMIFFCGSFFMAQLDYINLFCIIMTSIWLGGAGPVMVFGLYSRWGNSAGAFASLFTGMSVAVSGIILQRNWASSVYPFLEKQQWVDGIDRILRMCSAPFEPYIIWRMDAVKFPINSMEMFFIAMLLGIAAYCFFSLCSGRNKFNLERMLHRGKYSDQPEKHIGTNKTTGNFLSRILRQMTGISSDYTLFDKIIAWSVFIFTFVYQFGLTFAVVLVWHWISPRDVQWWGNYFLVVSLIVPGIIAAISTVWFTIGGIKDLKQMFRDLRTRIDNPLDNGSVSGNISTVDIKAFEKIDGQKIKLEDK